MGPHRLLHLRPLSWQHGVPERGAAMFPQMGPRKGGQRGQDKTPGKTLPAGQAWLRPHDFAAASPNISFHGNPGVKRGAFILASEFTLSWRGGGSIIGHLLGGRGRELGVYKELGRRVWELRC